MASAERQLWQRYVSLRAAPIGAVLRPTPHWTRTLILPRVAIASVVPRFACGSGERADARDDVRPCEGEGDLGQDEQADESDSDSLHVFGTTMRW
jgi:hypothetical protein